MLSDINWICQRNVNGSDMLQGHIAFTKSQNNLQRTVFIAF